MRQAPKQTAHVVILYKFQDGTHFARHWQGSSKANIVAAAKRKHPEAKVEPGNVWYTNAYGAH